MGDRFDPAKHLRKLRGRGGDADYLDVKWRIVWLRQEHPDCAIETEKIAGGMESNYAEFRALVSIPGKGSATGHGSESKADFGDFIEKAETKAIGRAIAALGYGTQFVGNELDEGERIVDSPVEPTTRPPAKGIAAPPRPAPTDRAAASPAAAATPLARGDQGNERATERQVRFIRSIAKEAGLDEIELEAWSHELYDETVDRLNRRDASTLIEALQRRRNEVA